MNSLNEYIDSLLTHREVDPDEIQSKIDEQIFFRYNSVNLVIGKRGSGKTYTTLREILKLPLLGHNEYTQIHYVTDKLNDDTVDKFRSAFAKNRLFFNWVPTKNAEKLITALAQTKALKRTQQSDADYKLLCKALSSDPLGEGEQELTDSMPHTIIIFDDCIGLFSKNTSVARQLFQNRQSRITYFLILQDVSGLSPSMKSNVDSLTLFGGFPKHKFQLLMYQMPPMDFQWEDYADLTARDFIQCDFIDGGVHTNISDAPMYT